MVKKISENEFQQVKDSKIAVVDFSATWCGPCKMLAPILERVSDAMDGKMDFYNVDVDENQSLAQQFGIMSIPSLVVFKDGKKVAQKVGFQAEGELLEFLNGEL